MNCEEQMSLLKPKKTSWRWLVLFSCSFLSFSNAIMWTTFSPCIYIFTEYYFKEVNKYTISAINMLSSIYMLVYPCCIYWVIQSSLNSKSSNTQKKTIILGAFLNLFGGFLRWLGSASSLTGFVILFSGQTVDAIAQLFILTLVPQLVTSWFPLNEVNLATSIAIASNGLGVGIGCALTPLVIGKSTTFDDIPQLLFIQLILCLLAFVFVWVSFQKTPPYFANIQTDFGLTGIWKEKSFLCLLGVFGITFGGQCAIISLLAQILLPPFNNLLGEQHVGLLGAMMIIVGCIGSLCIGYYLDKTSKYLQSGQFMCWISALAVMALFVSIEMKSVFGSIAACIGFGIASYGKKEKMSEFKKVETKLQYLIALIPTLIQFACEILYPINDIVPTGYLFSAGNMSGTLLVAFMSSIENSEIKFSMRSPMVCLILFLFISVYLMHQVKGDLNRTSKKHLPL